VSRVVPLVHFPSHFPLIRNSKNSPALVGYAAIDGSSDFRTTLANYLTCDSSATSIDMYGLNV
jgi:hypothetical protein